ncbi:interleukin 17 receptor A1a isoform X2 [Osmerus mordax]|uniref:interleukin 17 receptor A1a isoform X2 n=1 Tax=Osmerus mordax TaxID=8014 RepID=UPI00350F0D13
MTLAIVPLLFGLVSITSALSILEGPALKCAQEGLYCKVKIYNCLDGDWLKPKNYTPGCPVELEVDVHTRRDEKGDLRPVLVVRWKAKDDGSISFLKGTEVNVLMLSNNRHICVGYLFSNSIGMRNPKMEMWSFSLDRVVVEPGLSYVVTVSNLPKPNLKHTSYNIHKRVEVPGCDDPRMQGTETCLETGILWKPNMTLQQSTSPAGRNLLTLGFSTDKHADDYRVLLKCLNDREYRDIAKDNQTSLSVNFDLEKWPGTCCRFDAEIQPFFPLCSNDCVRLRKTFDICQVRSTPQPPSTLSFLVTTTIVCTGVVFSLTVCCIIYRLLRGRKTEPLGPLPVNGKEQSSKPSRKHPRVLIIYSQDHPLYKDIVLKLGAFLQAKCGIEVVLDLLDTTWLGTMGRLPWLDWQWQSTDKVLFLCSAGVQAKWRAICGQPKVNLREDVLSSIDDMLTPALNLFLPDMQKPAAKGKYLVAYFEDVSTERDSPSVFDIAIKYKLMKHFEELCFQILEVEKYQPGQVSHIEGIREEDYFNCPSGEALKLAVEAFQVYQFEHPDWFEKECVANEEEALSEHKPLLIQAPPVYECVPEYRDGAPIHVVDVEINQEGDSIYMVTPEVNQECQVASVSVLPRMDSSCHQMYPLEQAVQLQPGVLLSDLQPHGGDPFYMATPAVCMPGRLTEDRSPLEEWSEEDLSPSLPSPEDLQRLIALQLFLSSSTTSLSESAEEWYLPPHPSINVSQPVEMEEEGCAASELVEASDKRPISGSDQGYISRISFPDEQLCENPMANLARLQEELFQSSL